LFELKGTNTKKVVYYSGKCDTLAASSWSYC